MIERCRRCRSEFKPAPTRIGKMLREARMCMGCFSVRGERAKPPARESAAIPRLSLDRSPLTELPPMIRGRVERERSARCGDTVHDGRQRPLTAGRNTCAAPARSGVACR